VSFSNDESVTNDSSINVNRGDVVFGDSEIITSAVLGATVANSRVDFTTGGTTTGGNMVQDNAFRGATGINAVNQNTAPNAVTQQSITVNANISD
jgi:hypothetical protein